MKHPINEIKRMQQLAGIIKENNSSEDINNPVVKIAKVNWDGNGDVLATPDGMVIKSDNEKDPFLVFANNNKLYYAYNLKTDKLVEINPEDVQIIGDYTLKVPADFDAVKMISDKIANNDIADGIATITSSKI